MKKLFINHIRFMALPAVIGTGTLLVRSYMDGELGIKEAGGIVLSGLMMMVLLFPVYLVLRVVWHRLAKLWRLKA